MYIKSCKEIILSLNSFRMIFLCRKVYKLKLVGTFMLQSLNQPFNQNNYLLCRHCLSFNFYIKLNMVVYLVNIHFI